MLVMKLSVEGCTCRGVRAIHAISMIATITRTTIQTGEQSGVCNGAETGGAVKIDEDDAMHTALVELI